MKVSIFYSLLILVVIRCLQQTPQVTPPQTPPPFSPPKSSHQQSTSRSTKGRTPATDHEPANKPKSIWDLETVSESDIPPELTPIQSAPSNEKTSGDDVVDGQPSDWRSGRVTPPTAVAYQSIDQLSPILQEQAFPSEPLHFSGERSKPKFKKVMFFSRVVIFGQ